MKKIILILSALAMLFAWGCATTGDPNQGGLFGWSEAKAQARLAEKQRILDEEERRTRELNNEIYVYQQATAPEVTE